MDPKFVNVGTLLTKDYRFEIPPYHRPFVWNYDINFNLWQSIWDSYKNCDEKFYLGSVFAVELVKSSHFRIIDGHQRLVALTIMLCGIRDLVDDPAQKNKLQYVPYQGGISGESAIPRIAVRQQDQEFFKNYVLEGMEIPEFQYKELKANGDTSNLI